jgi:uncharacterized protein (TIGR03437 family)
MIGRLLFPLLLCGAVLAQPAVQDVVNAASSTSAVSPCALAGMSGADLAGLPVSVNGVPAQVLYSGADRVIFQIPCQTALGEASVAAGASAPFPITVQAAAPAIFAPQAGRGAALNADGTLNGPGNPQTDGGMLSVFLTGAAAALPSAATVGGQNAPVLSLAPVPGFDGLEQAGIAVPRLPPADYAVIFNLGGERSNAPLVQVTSSLPAGSTAPIDTGAGPWLISTAPSTPVPMDDLTVFAFSQQNADGRDPQVVELRPDIDIRAWQRWDRIGTESSDYDFAWVGDCHAAGIRFIGGSTATVLFPDEASSDAQFRDWASRDASGNLVDHSDLVPGAHRGSLANPSYRDYLVRIGKLQIDGGVDGLFYDEVNNVAQGQGWDGNEGFDDYRLADFNAYLLAKYPAGTDFQALFGMTPDNTLHRDVPQSDLVHNFNYRTYLATHGWSRTPYTPANPLAREWARPAGNRVPPGAPDFLNASEPYRYWKQIVAELREYAWQKYHRRILMTSNGIFPYVDFQSVGLYDWNPEGVDWCPVVAGHLNGSISLQTAMLGLKAQSERIAPGVPVVLFIDWPTTVMDRYNALPLAERQDYWRMYAAEAYANGLFFAFHLKTTTGEPTATQAGVMPLFKSLAAFYRAHANYYHHVTPSAAQVSVPENVMVAVSDQAQPQRRLVHLVNHNYQAGFVEQRDIPLAIPSATAPASVTLASPDQAQDSSLTVTYSDGLVHVVVPSLLAYNVIALTY